MTVYRVTWEAGSPNVAEAHSAEVVTWRQAANLIESLSKDLARDPNGPGVRAISVAVIEPNGQPANPKERQA